MDKSFKTWRNSQTESSHDNISDEDSDNIICSNSEDDIVILPSDSEEDVSFLKSKSQSSSTLYKKENKMSPRSLITPKTVVKSECSNKSISLGSDRIEKSSPKSESSSENISSARNNLQKTSLSHKVNSKNISSDSNSVQKSSLKSEVSSKNILSESSRVQQSFFKTGDSTKKSSLGSQRLLRESISSSSLKLPIRSKVKKNVILDSDSSSDSIDETFEHSLNQSPFHDESICSSTRLVDDDTSSSHVESNSKQNSENDLLGVNNLKLTEKALDRKTTVDLTLGRYSNAFIEKEPNHKNSFINIKNTKRVSNDKPIIVDSDSEEDKSKYKLKVQKEVSNIQVDLTNQFSSIKISPDKQKPKLGVPTSSLPSNDLSSRIESLKAEEARLGMEVSGVVKQIEATKSTFRTVNVSALPDKGIRLGMSLKKYETKLRDLRYQQSTVSNEILKLQFTHQNAANTQTTQPLKQPMFKLPTTTTDINAMGKKAMETHRVQQAMTVDALRSLHNSLKSCPTDETVVSDPKGLLVQLMPHQKHAVAWLLWREREKPSGGILADDMGLGKTLTMISLVLKSSEEEENTSGDEDDDGSEGEENSPWLSKSSKSLPKLVQGKTLVVCPASLLGQWEGEVRNKLKKHMLEVVIHHGSNREQKPRRLAASDIVITTYNIINRDATKEQSPLFSIRWRRVILDEAHQVRNFKTQTAIAVCKLKAKSRWALTGTPIHNKEVDLYALLKFLRCRPFDDLAVWKKWVDNKDAAGMQRLTTITKSIMLRRTKQGLQEKGELKGLTEKSFYNITITLDKEEKDAYEKLLIFSKTLFAQFLYQKAEKENALNGLSSGKNLNTVENLAEKHPELAKLLNKMNQITDVKSHTILVLILRLRQFCCHPALIKKMLENEDVANVGIEDNDGLDLDLMDKMTRMSLTAKKDASEQDEEPAMSDLSLDNPLFADDRLSSKMKKVVKTLEEILEGQDKVIVVSQWVSLLNLVRMVLRERNIKCAVLTGAVPIPDRAEVVDKFNRKDHNPRVLLLSLTAGGVGLNLVGGNHLLLLDLHWNPQLESQACDRIYRVGQEKPVHIYKFISSETIEERILQLQTKKLEIANSVLTGSKHTNKLTMDDLKTLFQIQ